MPRLLKISALIAATLLVYLVAACSGERETERGYFISKSRLGLPEARGVLAMYLDPDDRIGVITERWADGRSRLVLLDWDSEYGFTDIERTAVLPAVETGDFEGVSVDSAGDLLIRYTDRDHAPLTQGGVPQRVRWFAMHPDGSLIGGFTSKVDSFFEDKPVLVEHCRFKALQGRFIFSDWDKTPDPQPPQLARLSPSGEVLDHRVFEDFRLIGDWNEPDTICYVSGGVFYKWTNDGPDSMPVEVDAAVPPEGFMHLTRQADGSWIGIHSPRIARIAPGGEVDWIYHIPDHPDWQPSPVGEREVKLTPPYPTAFETGFRHWKMASNGRFLFGPGRPWDYVTSGGSGVWMIPLPEPSEH